MKSKSSIAAGAFAACLAGATLPAAAQDTGFYVGASAGVAGARQVCANTIGGCDDRETSLRLFGGQQLHRNLSVEGGYQYFGTFSQGSRGVFSNAVDIVAVGSWPITQEVSVYGKAGGYLARTSSAPASEDNSGFVYGLGGEYALSRAISLRGEWQRYNNVGGGGLGFNTDIDVLSVGIVWRPR